MDSQSVKNAVHAGIVAATTAGLTVLEKLLTAGIPTTHAAFVADAKIVAGAALAALCAYMIKIFTFGSSAKQ
jgi:hypothetical protein